MTRPEQMSIRREVEEDLNGNERRAARRAVSGKGEDIRRLDGRTASGNTISRTRSGGSDLPRKSPQASSPRSTLSLARCCRFAALSFDLLHGGRSPPSERRSE